MRDTSEQEGRPYRFGDYTVDTARACLLHGSERIDLRPKSYDALKYLLDNQGRLVTKDELMGALWPTTIVTDGSLVKCVQDIRQALGDDAHELIRTVPRRGYVLDVPGRTASAVSENPAERADGQGDAASATGFLDAGTPAASTAARRLTRPWLGIAAGLIVAAGGLTLFLGADVTQTVAKSVAVLPFENLSPDPDNDYFAAGVHDSILNQLVKIGDLKTIARTSVLRYANTEKPIAQIARELNVRAVMEGSVQFSDNRVRVSAQLIDPETDLHVWSEEYDRPLTAQNMFAIQREIAVSVAETLQATLSPGEVARLEEVPTQNTRAYDFYLSGNAYLRRRDSDDANAWLALQQYERAVEEDPEFALAWTALSRAHSRVYWFELDRTKQRRQLALDAVERAFEISPDLPEAHLALGYYHWHGFRDAERALEEWAIAERGMPADAELYWARAVLFRRLGDWERAVANLDHALELDPRNIARLAPQMVTYELLRDYTRAERVLERILEIEPDNRFALRRMPVVYFRRGDLTSVAKALEFPASHTEPDPWWLWCAALNEENYDAALSMIDGWQLDADDKAWYYGLTYHLTNRPELARPYLETARATIEQLIEGGTHQVPRQQAWLAEIMAHLGETEAAIALARRAMAALPTSEDAVIGTHPHLGAIRTFVAAGEYDTALKELDTYLSMPGRWSVEGLALDPSFRPIRDDPGFQALVRKYGRRSLPPLAQDSENATTGRGRL